MCGGRVELIPCTVVAHMLKAVTYKMATADKGGMEYNNNRIAEIWLDEPYKTYYYRALPKDKTRNFGNVTDRLILKEKLGCKSFQWYLDNVHPKMSVPDNLKDEEWLKKEQLEGDKNELEKGAEKLKVDQNMVKKELEQDEKLMEVKENEEVTGKEDEGNKAANEKEDEKKSKEKIFLKFKEDVEEKNEEEKVEKDENKEGEPNDEGLDNQKEFKDEEGKEGEEKFEKFNEDEERD